MKLNLVFLYILMSAFFISCSTEESVSPSEHFVKAEQISSRKIIKIIEDAEGYVWIGTSHGLNRYNGKYYHQYYSDPDDSNSLADNVINDLCCDSNGDIWICSNKGVNKYCSTEGILLRIGLNSFITRVMDVPGKDYVLVGNMYNLWKIDKETGECSIYYQYATPNYRNTFLLDKEQHLWVFCENDILCLNMDDKHTLFSTTTESDIQSVFLLDDFLYIETIENLQAFSLTRKKWMNESHNDQPSTLKKQNRLQNIVSTNKHTLLVSSDNTPLEEYAPDPASGQLKLKRVIPFQSPEVALHHVFYDTHDNLWLGAEEQGIFMVSNNQETFNQDLVLTSFFKGKSITHLCPEKKGQGMLIVSESQHLYYKTGNKISKVEHALLGLKEHINAVVCNSADEFIIAYTNKVVKIRLKGNSAEVIGTQNIPMPLHLYITQKDALWVVSAMKKLYVVSDSLQVVNTIDFPAELGIPIFLDQLPDNRIIIGDDGTHGILTYDPQTRSLEVYPTRQPSLTAYDYYVDTYNNVWLATNKGLYKITLNDKEVVRLKETDGLITNAVSIIGYGANELWIGTLNGLVSYQVEQKKVIPYFEEDGLISKCFTERCIVQLKDSMILMGNNMGVVSFYPNKISPKTQEALRLEYLTEGGEIKQNLRNRKKVTLSYQNSGISVSYSSRHSYETQQAPVEYWMEGFDPDWNITNGKNDIFYSHLPHGNYKLHIKYADSAMTSGQEETISIQVTPPFYLNGWMLFLIYPALILALGYIIYRLIHLAQEKEREKHVAMMNMRFFSNISHEYRTPLTLIHGATELLKNTSEGNTRNELMGILQYNTNRMLQLVNQMMDFNKLEDDALRLCTQRMDVVDLIHQIVMSFTVSLQQHQIQLVENLPKDPVIMWVDADKIEKILTNLISNAVKYASDGKYLEVEASCRDNQFIFSVADHGPGIPADMKEKVFERFTQLNKKTVNPRLGTGVGLHYVKSLVKLHHGQILCQDNEDKGCQFVVKLPMEETYYTEEERNYGKELLTFSSIENLPAISSEPVSEHKNEDKPTIMIVDDDYHVLSYLKILLSPYYALSVFQNAVEALDSLRDSLPALIISDVMMDEMDGYTFCKRIKQDSAICHIPVILLTAKGTIPEQVKGLDKGASAYITKPFSNDYLLAMIQTQLDNVKRIQHILVENISVKEEVKIELSSSDQTFMEQLYQYMENHLSDGELKLDELLKEVGMSRTKFFAKIKSLTGETPNSFFKHYKLNKAVEMILQGEDKLSTIAYMTGFSSPGHFTTSFKQHFGMTPTEYIKNNNK